MVPIDRLLSSPLPSGGRRFFLFDCTIFSSGTQGWSPPLAEGFYPWYRGCRFTLVHDRFLSAGSPHSSASQPPSPQGKALGSTMYHKKVQHHRFARRWQSLPRGGRWAGRKPGSDEGYLPHGIGRVFRLIFSESKV